MVRLRRFDSLWETWLGLIIYLTIYHPFWGTGCSPGSGTERSHFFRCWNLGSGAKMGFDIHSKTTSPRLHYSDLGKDICLRAPLPRHFGVFLIRFEITPLRLRFCQESTWRKKVWNESCLPLNVSPKRLKKSRPTLKPAFNRKNNLDCLTLRSVPLRSVVYLIEVSLEWYWMCDVLRRCYNSIRMVERVRKWEMTI